MQQQQQATVPLNTGMPLTAPAPLVVATPPENAGSSRMSVSIGKTLIVCGGLSIICNIVEFVVGSREEKFVYGTFGYGLWTGAMCIIAGTFGIVAGRGKAKRQIKIFNVFCILSTVAVGGQLIISALRTTFLSGCHWSIFNNEAPCNSGPLYMKSCLALLAIVETISSIWGSAISCTSQCCCCCAAPAHPVYVTTDGRPVMIAMNQQQVADTACATAPPLAQHNTQALDQHPPVYNHWYTNATGFPQHQ